MQFNYPHYLFRVLPKPGSVMVPWIDVAFRNRVAPSLRPGMTEIDFHREVQAEMVETLRASGNKVEENIRLTAPNPTARGGEWLYDADWIAKPSNSLPVIFEVKTSITKKGFDEFDGSEFRRKQFQVIVLANLGGHVVCFNPRIRNVDLIPFLPLPPLAIEILYALPGRPYVGEHIDPLNLQGAVSALSHLGVIP